MVEETAMNQSEETNVDLESSDSPPSPRISVALWRTLLGVSLALAILVAGQSINAIGL